MSFATLLVPIRCYYSYSWPAQLSARWFHHPHPLQNKGHKHCEFALFGSAKYGRAIVLYHIARIPYRRCFDSRSSLGTPHGPPCTRPMSIRTRLCRLCMHFHIKTQIGLPHSHPQAHAHPHPSGFRVLGTAPKSTPRSHGAMAGAIAT